MDGEWGEKDHLLTVALTAYKDGLCRCGKPIAIAHHEDNNGWYVPRTTVCNSCAAVEKFERDRDPKASMTLGEMVYPLYERTADKPLGS